MWTGVLTMQGTDFSSSPQALAQYPDRLPPLASQWGKIHLNCIEGTICYHSNTKQNKSLLYLPTVDRTTLLLQQVRGLLGWMRSLNWKIQTCSLYSSPVHTNDSCEDGMICLLMGEHICFMGTCWGVYKLFSLLTLAGRVSSTEIASHLSTQTHSSSGKHYDLFPLCQDLSSLYCSCQQPHGVQKKPLSLIKNVAVNFAFITDGLYGPAARTFITFLYF